MSPIAGYTTSVDASKTAAEVGTMLAKRGASRVMTEYGDGRAVGLSFEIGTGYGVRGFVLPIRAEGVLATLKSDRRRSRSALRYRGRRPTGRDLMNESERVCAPDIDNNRAYCGRKNTRTDEWSRVNCRDCVAAWHADGNK